MRVGVVVGDVIDIGILRTTLVEIGGWVQADQYAGRIAIVANRVVISDRVSNYTKCWLCPWDEIAIPVTHASNWRGATEIVLEHAREYTASFHAIAQAG